MNKLMVRTGLMGLLAVAALGLGGCNNNLKDENQALRENNAKLESDNVEKTKQLADSEARRNEAEGKATAKDADIARLQNELATKQQYQPPVSPNTGSNGNGGGGRERTHGTTRKVLAGDVLFSPGSATLTAAGKKEIDKVIADIKRMDANDTIRVEGYTDSDPIKKSSFGSNKALSQARAEAVEKYMGTKGIKSSRISAVGMGAENPKGTKAASRRVEIVIVDN